MSFMTLARFNAFCIEKGVSKFIFSTGEQEDDVKICGMILSMSFSSMHIMLQPNCVLFKNADGCIKFSSVKRVQCIQNKKSCYSFIFICKNPYDGEEIRHNIIGFTQ